MKLIEPTQKTVEKDTHSERLLIRSNSFLQFGKTDEYAEDAIVARFMRGLDNRFIMLRNLQLEGNGEMFRPILIGPAGMYRA